jgi:hypothetical protein
MVDPQNSPANVTARQSIIIHPLLRRDNDAAAQRKFPS